MSQLRNKNDRLDIGAQQERIESAALERSDRKCFPEPPGPTRGVNSLRFIPTILHGIGDYVFSLIVIGLPFLYGWTGSQRWVLIALGIFLLLYSVCTDYEFGAARVLRVQAHMFLDVIFGLLMLTLPWLLNFSRDSFVPTSVIGTLSLLTVLTKIPAHR